MNRSGRLLLGMCLAGLLSVTAAGGEEPVDSARWRALAERLAAQLEGTAAPINLARTRLASVSASSVNGGRPLANRYYGVLNLFDDGRNWLNGINYTYWLSGGDLQPWVEVRFDTPVIVTSIFVEGRPSFTTQLFMAKGGQHNHPAVRESLELPAPLPGVSRLRLTFTPGEDGENIKVFEVRVMGYPPEGADAAASRPRVAMSRADAVTVARERLETWKRQLMGPVAERVREVGDDSWEVVFRGHSFDLLRVVVDSRLGARVEPLARLVPAAGPSGERAPEPGAGDPSQD